MDSLLCIKIAVRKIATTDKNRRAIAIVDSNPSQVSDNRQQIAGCCD